MTSGGAGNDNKRQDEKWGHIPALKGLDEDLVRIYLITITRVLPVSFWIS